MKALLMHRDRDFAPKAPLPWNARALIQDLALAPLFAAMADGDELVHQVAQQALLAAAATELDAPEHRQPIVRDALANPAAIRALYGLTGEAIEERRKHLFGIWSRYPTSVLYSGTELMRMYAGYLRRLRDLARAHAAAFTSPGFGSLFAMLERELPDEYFDRIDEHLAALKFRGGTLIAARLGPRNEGRDYFLRPPGHDDRGWLRRLFSHHAPGFTYRVPPRDEAGTRALSEIEGRGIHLVANALAQAVDHVEGFFHMLRTELAFYVGCVNLHERLTALGEPTCLPRVHPTGARRLRGAGLYDPCLALQAQRALVGNAIDADGAGLIVITGANQGGKSTLLRALGVAQLMMQAGMFVAAESFESERCVGLVTHFKREEDAALKSGKLDEELVRLSELVDHLAADAVVLFNESFASTNEREGSEIARQVTSALLERRVKVVFVTHLHDFARSMVARRVPGALFLRADRQPNGTRTFKILPGEPLSTSFGADLYARIFDRVPR